MKNKLQATLVIRHSLFTGLGTVLLAAIALFTAAPGTPAQNVTLSAAGFQQMVYSADLHTRLTLKPELQASLQVLLETQRRSPNADPLALAGMSSNALAIYRGSAPCYIRTNGYPDEVLAAYLEAVRQVPGHSAFFPADLTLLNCFMLNQAEEDYFTNYSNVQLINSEDQRMFLSSGQASKRQALVDNCVARAQANPAFATAMESLLLPETQVSLTDTAAEIIGNTNSPLQNNLTMQTLLALSAASSDGSVTVSTNQLMDLYTNEMQTIQNTINTNLAVLAGINENLPDYLYPAYLTNQAAVDYNVQLQAAVQQGQPAQIACATAAVLVQSKLLPVNTTSAAIEQGVSAGMEMALGISKLCDGDADGIESVMSSGMDLVNGISGTQSSQDVMANEIGNIQTTMGDLSTNMNYRFDRVDQSLSTIYNTLNVNFTQIDSYLQSQGQQLSQLQASVNDIRSYLVGVQADLDRLEAEVIVDLTDAQHTPLIDAINANLLYEVQHPLLPPIDLSTYLGAESLFYSYAIDLADDSTVSPTNNFSSSVEVQLTTLPLNDNLNYIKWILGTLGQSTAGKVPLANPQEWFVAAYAFLQLAGENPMWFRDAVTQQPVSDISSRGQNVANFLGSLTFNGTNINWGLYNALETFYVTNLVSFYGQVSNIEFQFANSTSFALGTWRQWDLAAPRLTATATALRFVPEIPTNVQPREPATRVAAGAYHSLALMAGGTVVSWGDNSYGETTIPAGLTSVAAIAAGADYSLALTTNGAIIGWGDDDYGQTNVPGGLTNNVVAVAAGAAHSLALIDGSVVAWGDNDFGQTNVPTGLTNVVQVAAGADHSLALTSGGAVVGWGAGSPGSSAYALSFDGVDDEVSVPNQAALNAYPLTISAWINTTQTSNGYGSGIVNKYVSDSGDGYQLFLYFGHIHAWYFNGGSPSGYIYEGSEQGMDGGFVADGRWHQVAFVVDANGGRIFVDGALTASMAWTGTPGPTTTLQPLTLGCYSGGFYSGLMNEARIWNVARSQAEIQADMMHRLKGTEPGLIAYWKLDEGTGTTATNSAVTTGSACNGAIAGPAWVPGWGEFGQATIPPSATSVTAIAAGWFHSLAVNSALTPIAWGDNSYGQANSFPVALSGHTVAVAAGGRHSLALETSGTVVAWGDNTYGQTNVPGGLNHVVAIAAGAYHSLALKSDGTIVAWGRMNELQCLEPPAVTWHGALAAGISHTVALNADGRVVGWGGWDATGDTIIPASWTNAVAIAAGDTYSLALQANGTVAGWGNVYGQAVVPAGLSNVVAIAAGDLFGLALKADGRVVSWGDNGYGETNVPASATNVVAISASDSGGVNVQFAMALKADGTVVAWGDDAYGQTDVPTGLSNVVAIAAGGYHCMALKADGTVVAWGDNLFMETDVPTGLSGVVAIAAGYGFSLALKANGTVVNWGYPYYDQTVPTGLNNVVAIAANNSYSLALQANGTIVGWGAEDDGTITKPMAWKNVVAIAQGVSDNHGLGLTANGAMIGWGDDLYGQSQNADSLTSVAALAVGWQHSLALLSNGTLVAWGAAGNTPPAGLNNVAAIAAGADYNLGIYPVYPTNCFNLALLSNGTVVGWGDNSYGETNIPGGLKNVVAIAAGAFHGLALTAGGTVVGWGDNHYGQTNTPSGLNNVVAIAAGDFHSLALKTNGTVVGWGLNSSGQTNIPPGLSNVVAIAAGEYHNVALKADGTVVAWGNNVCGQTNIPPGLSNVVAIAANGFVNVFLTATNASGFLEGGNMSFVDAAIPERVAALFYDCNTNTLYQMSLAGPMNTSALALNGAKTLMTSVLQLGMPYTLARDGILHGFLYGSGSLIDSAGVTNYFQSQDAELQAAPNAPPQDFGDVAALRYQGFVNRLNQCLSNLQATGQPEIPRVVGHTLRLFDLLYDSWSWPTNSAPPALELSSASNGPSLLLYGEPYMYYTLQYSDTLNAPGWTTTTITNLQDEQTITPPLSGSPHRFYRVALPVP